MYMYVYIVAYNFEGGGWGVQKDSGNIPPLGSLSVEKNTDYVLKYM